MKTCIVCGGHDFNLNKQGRICRDCTNQRAREVYHGKRTPKKKRPLVKLKTLLVIKKCRTCGMELLPYRKDVRLKDKDGKTYLTTQTIRPKTYCDKVCYSAFKKLSTG